MNLFLVPTFSVSILCVQHFMKPSSSFSVTVTLAFMMGVVRKVSKKAMVKGFRRVKVRLSKTSILWGYTNMKHY